ncbi:MAG: shikimate dehydrogenase [Azospirillum sp.]|nr:shikimate dehydrogenase [Azospirillum sp.]
MSLTGKSRIAGVIGWPVAHSRSPRLHGWWLEHYRIDGAYIPLAVPPERAREAIGALAALGLRGANVTVPHKETAFLAIGDREPSALRVGAVNTIVVAADGRLIGSNTDGFGFLANLDDQAPGWRDGAGAATVVGAGGAARAVVAALLDAGFVDIRLVNRTAARATALADLFGIAVRVWPWQQRADALDGAALLINTTTLGMVGMPALDLDLKALPKTAVVNDIVYTPLMTPLLAEAQIRGHRIVDGLGMLLHQARPGFAAWFGMMPEVTPELRQHMLRSIDSEG